MGTPKKIIDRQRRKSKSQKSPAQKLEQSRLNFESLLRIFIKT
jgi:hypothetical protein